jgi:hypothetical protein
MLSADTRPYHLFVYRPVAKPDPPLFQIIPIDTIPLGINPAQTECRTIF